jgi:3-phenylpropionate/cinnamic acid dioxygenase small subunit
MISCASFPGDRPCREREGESVTAAALDPDDRQQVTDVLVRYATAIDRRDWDLLRTCFIDDCDADYGEYGHWHGGSEIAEWMEKSHVSLGSSIHLITNVALAPMGDAVTACCYIHGVVLTEDRAAAIHAFGRYDDELVSTPEGWKIARRRYTAVNAEIHTLMGSPP